MTLENFNTTNNKDKDCEVNLEKSGFVICDTRWHVTSKTLPTVPLLMSLASLY